MKEESEDYRNYQRAAYFLWELLDRIAQEGDVTLAERRHEQALVVNGVLRWRWKDVTGDKFSADETTSTKAVGFECMPEGQMPHMTMLPGGVTEMRYPGRLAAYYRDQYRRRQMAARP